MSNVAVERWGSPEAYLAFERAAVERHEYINGEIYAMAGTSYEHSSIAASLLRILGNHLLGRPCQTHGSDLRVYNPASGSYVYPDVSVICGKPEFTDSVLDTVKNPLVIVEILSDSTEEYDRGDKFMHYQRLESLRVYVLVSQKEARIEVYMLRDESWEMKEFVGLESVFEIEPLGFSAPLGEGYRGVKFALLALLAPAPPAKQ